MSKGKLAKFADMASYPHVFEYPYSAVDNVPFEMKGKWNESFFGNDRPIVLELGCGRGEYTVGLGRLFPDKILSEWILKVPVCGPVLRSHYRQA